MIQDIQNRDIVIVGGGAAGMMAALKAAEAGCFVTILEKNDICGKKILITGKGRCNLTNNKEWSEFSTHIHPVAAFLRPAFYNFDNFRTVEYFNSIGLPTSVEQGGRIFPLSMRAADVPKVMVSRLKELGVEIIFGADVNAVSQVGEMIKCTYCLSPNGLESNSILSKAVIIATGGLSYPSTGSTGMGYELAESFSHTIVNTFPSLTALVPEKYDESLYGIELNNVELNLMIDKDMVQSERGDVSFTAGGIEGSLGYRVSRKAVKALINGQKVALTIDLKPALSLAQLSDRISRDVAALGASKDNLSQSQMKLLLRGLMPAALIAPFMAYNKDLNVDNLPAKLKEWYFVIKSYVGYKRAVVTAGGVAQSEIVAKSMRSKLVPNLYFAGEVIDIDGDTGGYNLQIAFSTGALAGTNAAQQILKLRRV